MAGPEVVAALLPGVGSRRRTHAQVFACTWFAYCASATIMPHLTRYYDLDLNLSDWQIGFLLATPALLNLFWQPLWGVMADRVFGRTRTYRAGLLLAAASLGLFAFSYQLGGYGLLLCSACLMMASFMLNGPLLTALILSFLGKDRAHEFGKIRVAGSISFALTMILICPQMVHLSHYFHWYARTGVFLAGCGFILAAFCCTFWDETQFEKQERPPLHSFLELGKKWNLVALYVSIFFVSMGSSAGFQYLGPYVGNRGFSEMFYSSLWLIGVSAEVMLSLMLQKIIRKVGLRRIMIIGFLADAFRWVGLSQANSPYALMALSSLHGPVVIGLFFVSAIYIDSQCDRNIRSTAQTLIFFSIFSGQISGYIMGSAIVSSYTELVRSLAIQHGFFWFGIASLLGAVVCALFVTPEQPKEIIPTLPMDEMAC